VLIHFKKPTHGARVNMVSPGALEQVQAQPWCWRNTGPEDREEWLRRKQINKCSIYSLSPGWLSYKCCQLMVESVIRRLPNCLCPTGRIHHRTHVMGKWSLLKIRKGKYKRDGGGAQVESGDQKSVLLFFRCF
jgi:hypothetical protein